MSTYDFKSYGFVQYKFVNYLSAGDVPPPVGQWILTTGFWNDSGAWDDNAAWVD